MKIKLIKIVKRSSDINSYIFKNSKGILWKGGQYLVVSLKHENPDLKGKMRFITISSSPFEKHIMFTTRIFKKNPSSFKKALSNLKIGETIEVKGPDGDLTVENLKRKYIFIAGGMGITPFRSILSQLNFEKKSVDIHLMYVNRNKNFLFKSELDEILKNNKKFKIDYFITPFRFDSKIFKSLNLDFKNTFFYISGPEKMIEDIKEVIEKLGAKRENIKEDYFLGYKKI